MDDFAETLRASNIDTLATMAGDMQITFALILELLRRDETVRDRIADAVITQAMWNRDPHASCSDVMMKALDILEGRT